MNSGLRRTLHGVGPDRRRVAMLRAPRPLLVRLLIQLRPAGAPLVLWRGVVHVVPPVAVLLHHAVREQAVDVPAVAGHAVLFAPPLTGVPVRTEGVRSMGRDVVIGKHLQRSDTLLQLLLRRTRGPTW